MLSTTRPLESTQHSTETPSPNAAKSANWEPQYPPLEQVTKPAVTTPEVAYYTNQAQQTWRSHACNETFPDGLRPIRIGNRLNWPTAGLKKLMRVPA